MDINFKASILLVDSAADNLVLMEELLQERYHVLLARTGADALRLARQSPPPDLVLLAPALPDMDGFTLLGDLQLNYFTADIPVVMLVAPHEEQHALARGAADIVTMPLLPASLLARVGTLMRMAVAEAKLKDQHSHLAHLVAERTRQAVQLQDATVLAMASLAESQDPDTGNHIRRTQHYVQAMARELRFKARYSAELSDENIGLLYKAAPLHDIGMVGVPDAILLKPGKLTEEEVATMRQHTLYGRDAIDGVERTLGAGNQFLRYAREIAWSHHEQWDGSGYPQGLAGQEIPLSARLMALADVYDALITPRTYRPAFTHETAVELIRQGSGEHFDPDVVDAMLAVEEKFKAIAAQFRRETADCCEAAA